MTEIPNEKIIVTVNNREVILDPENMKFNEFTLSEYMDKEYAWIDYYGKQLELATKELALSELAWETKYNEAYIQHKDSGGSDAYCKAKAQCDQECVKMQEKVIERRSTVGFLRHYLKAWDKNHDNAQNRGHTLRKELDKLNRDIYKDDKDDKMCNTDEFVK
jgi:hypothetical protein